MKRTIRRQSRKTLTPLLSRLKAQHGCQTIGKRSRSKNLLALINTVCAASYIIDYKPLLNTNHTGQITLCVMGTVAHHRKLEEI